jgi:DNA-binding transcriptional MerR regulator
MTEPAPRVQAMSDGAARKAFYKIGEVCQITDTQPYVLRFWESEFPQLAPKKSRSGQRIYRRKDVDLVLQIKRLLYEEGFTIAGARKKLGMAEGQGALDDLFEPSAAEEPERLPEPPRPLGSVLSSLSGRLAEVLKMMDETDRRLKGKG